VQIQELRKGMILRIIGRHELLMFRFVRNANENKPKVAVSYLKLRTKMRRNANCLRRRPNYARNV